MMTHSCVDSPEVHASRLTTSECKEPTCHAQHARVEALSSDAGSVTESEEDEEDMEDELPGNDEDDGELGDEGSLDYDNTNNRDDTNDHHNMDDQNDGNNIHNDLHIHGPMFGEQSQARPHWMSPILGKWPFFAHCFMCSYYF
jgi:hypothetical protein